MKRNERTFFNQLRKDVTESTIYVEIRTDWTHEGRQAAHEMLTTEKGMTALRINWNPIENAYTVLYGHGTDNADRADIETVTAGLKVTDTWWNGFHKPVKTTDEQNDEQNEEENEMDNNSIIETMRADIIAHTERSAWSNGVTEYALELLDSLAEGIEGGWYYADDIAAPRVLEKNLLNGADSWSAYSWGGSSLIYDRDIAERLCNPSELKRTHNGERQPNSREQWLDCQARALFQAARKVMDAARRATEAA